MLEKFRGYRLIRKISQKATGKTLFLKNALNSLYLSNIRKSSYVRNNIDYLVQNGFLKPNIDFFSVRDSILGNLVSISSFLQKISKV
ncbi:MAG: hypothetical protein COX48_00960 [bacterium (Candidatus Stahlbacteria) CG23_combo_of_CG06-09_8_20_14_all_34_7]|nr:MAG: hypothetical protein COX48_00960 [bacterium (Candidatus Stahlbacteria) CG23_combo_of_CG06-09_8_20_14_all_34_7]